MSLTISHVLGVPMLRLARGASRKLVVASPGFCFAEHWWHTHHMLCGGDHCPACELWNSKQRVIFAAHGFDGQSRAVLLGCVLPAESVPFVLRPGQSLVVTRLSTRMRVERGEDVQAASGGVELAAALLSQLYRLRPPRAADEVVSGRWFSDVEKVAEARLRMEVIRCN